LREEASDPKNHNYSFSQGEPFFREAVSDWYKHRFNVELDPENKGIILDKSAFYPGGGGQPADSGLLITPKETYQVSRIKKVGDRVIHFISTSNASY